ncbi:MAG: alkaline phosphatase family protein [Streptosporangiaceae bacterium]
MTGDGEADSQADPADRAAGGGAAVAVWPDLMPTLPRYGTGSLADLARSVLASLGAPGEDNPLSLPPAQRVCLLVIDGLGWELLRTHQAAAPFLSELAQSGRPLTAGFPATTVTSLSSLGTGRPPGQHGMLGYKVAVPDQGWMLNALRWDRRVDPLSWQRGSTIFERATAAGITALRVAHGSFRMTGLSSAVMRGADYRPADTLGALVAAAAEALGAPGPALAMVYHGDLDSTGHVWGCSSPAWNYQLSHVDRLVEQLAAALPPGTLLHVTADHGMVDVTAADRVDVDALPQLRDGVALLGGEPRARHVYTLPGAAADVLAGWQETLGRAAWVAGRDEAIADGWFGPVDERFAARIGDVVAAPSGSGAIVATRAEPRESALIGMHGSLTVADQLVPLLSFGTD